MTTTTVSARPGLLARWKNAEPVRLYLYGFAVVAILGLTLAGAITGEWSDFLLYAAGVLLGLVVPTEAVRASVYSPATALSPEHARALSSWRVAHPDGQ